MKLFFNSRRRQFIVSHLTRAQHIFNKYSVSLGRLSYHYVRDSTDKLAVLDNRTAAHECGQEGTTIINQNLIIESIHRLKSKL